MDTMIKFASSILFLTLTLDLLNLSQGQGGSKPMSRARALSTLKGCATRPITLGCSEDTADYLIKLYNHGDKALLKPLLDAGLTSDGALAETLGDFYSNVLWKNPRDFLEALKLRSRKDQHSLCQLAGVTDGGGMPDNMLRDVRHTLSQIASQHQHRLASVARVCLVEVNEANATNH
ncbi:MAG: hypothetical protein WBN92_05880 [Terriglobia bacterium]